MGLCTAYCASLMGKKVTILEKLTIPNKEAASFSLTRSIRNDYLDPLYSLLAYESQKLWLDLQKFSDEKFFIKCGCLNLARKDVTPELKKTYALKSYQNLKSLKLNAKQLNKSALKNKFPQFEADLGSLDVEAGFLYLPQITKTLLRLFRQTMYDRIEFVQNVKVQSINEFSEGVKLKTDKGVFQANKLVITAGIWTNQVLKIIKNCQVQFPIYEDKPSQCKYFIPPKKDLSRFTSTNLPVFAYLDVGIYGHPVLLGKTRGVKISYYNPPDIKKISDSRIQSIEDFVKICMPTLAGAKVIDVKDADQCSYDMVKDKNFIIGKLPGFKNIFIGTGWNGTGYKFAPIVGKILSELLIPGQTMYDIARFSPERFL